MKKEIIKKLLGNIDKLTVKEKKQFTNSDYICCSIDDLLFSLTKEVINWGMDELYTIEIYNKEVFVLLSDDEKDEVRILWHILNNKPIVLVPEKFFSEDELLELLSSKLN